MSSGDVGKRIRIARQKQTPLRIVDLARLVGVSHARLSNWERGLHDPPYEITQQIATALKISVDWLLGENVPMTDPKAEGAPVYRHGIRQVPIYGAISAGVASSNQSGDVIEWFAMMDWGGDFERWGRIVDGFSMEPDLQPGYFAIFEDRRAEVGHIVHAFHDGEDTVKQYRRLKERAMLVPTNPDYDVVDGESWHIKGVCVALAYKDDDGATVLKEYRFGMRPRAQRPL